MNEARNTAPAPRINPAHFTKHTREQIGSIFLAAITADMEKPEFREGFEKWQAERKARITA